MLEDWAVALAGSPWVYLAMYLFATIDGFFPPIPSESLIIALITLSMSYGMPNVWLVMLAAAAGAFTGDQSAYFIGSKVRVRELRLMRSPRAQAALGWAGRALEHSGPSFIIAARYVPIGRVAVNMTAGTLHYPRRRFTVLVALAAVTWAGYAALIGVGAGAWLGTHPVVAVVVGVVGGILIGLLVEWALRRWTAALGRRRARAGSPPDAPGGPTPDGPQVTDRSRSEPAA